MGGADRRPRGLERLGRDTGLEAITPGILCITDVYNKVFEYLKRISERFDPAGPDEMANRLRSMSKVERGWLPWP